MYILIHEQNRSHATSLNTCTLKLIDIQGYSIQQFLFLFSNSCPSNNFNIGPSFFIHSTMSTHSRSFYVPFNDVNSFSKLLYSFRNFYAATAAHSVTRLALAPRAHGTAGECFNLSLQLGATVTVFSSMWSFGWIWTSVGCKQCRSKRNYPEQAGSAILSLQQMLPFLTRNLAVVNEILKNVFLLLGHWIREQSSMQLAIFSLDAHRPQSRAK